MSVSEYALLGVTVVIAIPVVLLLAPFIIIGWTASKLLGEKECPT